MANTYSVAISYHSDLGWIDYDGDKKTAEVHLANAEGKKLTEDWLQHKHAISVPHETLMDFTEETVDPLADVESFKLALTRLWNNTQVTVDWSRPVDYVKAHPHY
ncbi:MAG: hypothetical protein II145_02465 [Selenomonas sp.]|jgi:hypothetical protein|nr:hypothetical protein [Selenomonas sp.]MCI7331212.1 hypothetical protein [Selenomonadaceae bacterium]MDD6120099.1 hypothetical protein [Selenomonadaceae bacterium]MDD7055788.1 hypothetical protein [Selenomonadaceae bacterium]MDY3916793.1 hypothetical protein [Selenomonadaceae bacterium]